VSGQSSIELPDGRALEYWSEGSDDGLPVLFHHGTPSSGLPYERFVQEATRRGMRLLSYSRPGYGGSDRREDRSVADCVGDVVALLDRLGIDRFLTAGWSGGGPHALACAALLPERVRAAATIAGVGPFGVDDLDFLDGMGKENIEEFGATIQGPDALRGWMEANAPAVANVTGAEVVAVFGDLVSDVDKPSINDEFGEFIATMMRLGLSNGWWGWYDDDVAFVRPWGFDIGPSSVPAAIWQGPHDRMVPFAHGEWLASHVGGARPRLRPEHGHLSLAVGSFGEILDDLVSLAE
jgi:pimeloyl-ACP methyl ester carboxylesterase